MIKRYDKQQARRLRMALVADDVYCIVSDALKKLYPEKTPLNSVEIWMAAHALTCDLIQSAAPEEIFDDLLEELKEEVSSSMFQDSSCEDEGLGKNTLFLILMVSMCQISALRKQIENADALLKREMEVCRKHEMYYKVLEQFDGKEIRMRMVNRKVDLLTYEMKEIGDNKEAQRQMLEGFAQAASMFSPQSFEGNLLALNYYNLQNGYIHDDLILKMYGQLEQKFEKQKTIEMIFGNKNIAEAGGMQMNGDMPQDLAGYLESFKKLNLLGNGK